MRKRLKNHFIPHEGNNFKPHFVREKSLVSIGFVAVAIFSLAFSLNSYIIRHPDLLSAVITGVLVNLTNSNRASQNLNILTENPTLAYAAQLKANDMAEKSYFAHTSPEGKSPWYWFTQGGYDFLYAGENLAVNFSDSENVVQAWMNSEGHRANILNDKFSEIGIAIAPGTYQGRDTIYVVQLFGSPAPEVTKQEIVVEKKFPQVVVLDTERAIATAGQAPEENVKVLAETKMFVAVQNNDYANFAPESETEIAQAYDDQSAQVAESVVEKTLASPKTALEIIYMAMGALVLLVLVLFVAIKPRGLHTKHVVYMVMLLVFLALLFYFTKNYLFTAIVIE